MYYFLVKVNLRSLLSSWSGVRLPLGVPPNFRHLPSLGGCHFFSIWLSFQSSFHPEEVPRLERPAWPRHGACGRSWGLQPSGWRLPARCAEKTWRERRRREGQFLGELRKIAVQGMWRRDPASWQTGSNAFPVRGAP